MSDRKYVIFFTDPAYPDRTQRITRHASGIRAAKKFVPKNCEVISISPALRESAEISGGEDVADEE